MSDQSEATGDELLGRVSELARFRKSLDSVVGGHGQLVFVSGEPGIGKTRFAQENCEIALQMGLQVYRGFAAERSGAPPYWIWSQPLRRLVRTIKSGTAGAAFELHPPLSYLVDSVTGLNEDGETPVYDGNSRYVLFEQVLNLIESGSSRQPALFLLDDLQWADESSLSLLEFIAYDITNIPILIIATYRSASATTNSQLADLLGTVTGKPGVNHFALGGLETEDVAALARSIGNKELSGSDLQALAARTGGNPLFIRELALSPESGDSRLPRTITDVIAKRLSILSPETRKVLEIAAALGNRFRTETVITIAESLDHQSALHSLDDALLNRILVTTDAPNVLAFSHGLIRQSIMELIAPMEAAKLHNGVANYFEDSLEAGDEAALAKLAFSALAAVPFAGAERAVRYGILAAEQALLAKAFGEARQLIDAVIDLLDENPSEPRSEAMADAVLLRAQSRYLSGTHGAGGYPDLVAGLAFAISRGDSSRVARIVDAWPTRSPGIPTRFMADTLRMLPEGSVIHACALGLFALAATWAGDISKGEELFAVANREVAQIESAHARLRVTTIEAWMDFAMARYSEGAEKFGEILHLQSETPDLPTYLHLTIFRGGCVTQSGIRNATDNYEELISIATRLRNPAALAEVHSVRAYHLLSEGDWGRVYESTSIVIDTNSYARNSGLGTKALTDFELGLESANENLEKYTGNLPSLESPEYVRGGAIIDYGALVPIVRAGGPLELLDKAERLIRAAHKVKTEQQTQFRNEWLYTLVALGQIAWLKRDPSIAGEVYGHLRDFPSLRVGPPAMVSTDEVLGMVAHLIGNHDEAQNHFELAREMYWRVVPEGGRNLPWLCVVQVEALMDAPGSARTRAHAIVEEGLQVAGKLGMVAAMNRLSTLKKTLDDSHSKRSQYPDGLTGREIEVLRELAGGSSNREIAETLFISQNTVIRHVSNIFSKTGCSNRAEAAAYAERNSLVT